MKNKKHVKNVFNVATNAFVSAVCGGLGSYAAHRFAEHIDTIRIDSKRQKRKIGFDLHG